MSGVVSVPTFWQNPEWAGDQLGNFRDTNKAGSGKSYDLESGSWAWPLRNAVNRPNDLDELEELDWTLEPE